MYLNDKLPAREVETHPEQACHRLMHAKTLIKRGWCQGAGNRETRSWFRRKTSYCSFGAMRAVSGGDYMRGVELAAIFNAANGNHLQLLKELWAWNDAPERTKADVLAAFDKAIAYAGLHYPD